MSGLALPKEHKLALPESAAPTNLVLRPSVKVRLVEHDMFDICERIKELSPRLFVLELEEGNSHGYAVMERAADGVERLVKRFKELDGRVIEDLQYMLNVPFEKRFELAEAEEQKAKEDLEKQQAEKFMEMAPEVQFDLRRLGFVDGHTGAGHAMHRGVRAEQTRRAKERLKF